MNTQTMSFRLHTSMRALVMAALIAVCGCAGSRPEPPKDDAGRIAHMQQLFDQGEYDSVILGLNRFLADRPGSRYVETAAFLIGRAYYEQGLDIDAEEQFRRVLREFPGGEVAPEAAYYLGLSLLSQSRGAQLDQTETRVALAQFRAFLSRYPDHELSERASHHIRNIRDKLAEKEYLNGRTYEKRGFHKAVRFYYEERVLEEYADTRWAVPAMAGLARSFSKTKEWAEAAVWAQKILDTDPDHEAAGNARKVLKKARENGIQVMDTGVESPAAANEPE